MNKKGFTLIELLAVIVILAIIALIATPIVLSIISDSKESASLRSAEMYLDAVEYGIADTIMNNKTIPIGTHIIMENGNICIGTYNNKACTGDIIEVEVNGETPKEGSTITIEKGKIEGVNLLYGDKTIVKDDKGILEYKTYLPSGLYVNGTMNLTWQELIDAGYFFVVDNTMTGYDPTTGYCPTKDSYPANKDDFSNPPNVLIIDNSVKIINDIDGKNCHGLPYVIVIQDSVVEIRNIQYFSTVYIPKSVKTIKNGALTQKEGIVHYEGTEEEWRSIIDQNDDYANTNTEFNSFVFNSVWK